jgi:hypothetical protein
MSETQTVYKKPPPVLPSTKGRRMARQGQNQPQTQNQPEIVHHHPMSPRDITPIVINGETITSARSPLNPPPVVDETIIPPTPRDIPQEEDAEQEEEEIRPRVFSPISNTSLVQDEIVTEIIQTTPSPSPSPALSPLIVTTPKQTIHTKPIPSYHVSPIASALPSEHTSPIPSPHNPDPLPTHNQPTTTANQPYVPLVRERVIELSGGKTLAVPKTLSNSSAFKIYRPIDIEETEFMTENITQRQYSDEDYEQTAIYWKNKLDRLHRRFPKLIFPTISDKETPKMGKFKFEQSYKMCTKHQYAVYVGYIIYMIVAVIEMILLYFNIRIAKDLFATVYNENEMLEDAFISVGERAFGWIKAVENPIWKLVITIGTSVLILLITNAITLFLPSTMASFVEQYKDGGIKFLQELSGVFLGTKAINPEKDNDFVSKIMKAMNWADKTFFSSSSKERPMHDD